MYLDLIELSNFIWKNLLDIVSVTIPISKLTAESASSIGMSTLCELGMMTILVKRLNEGKTVCHDRTSMVDLGLPDCVIHFLRNMKIKTDRSGLYENKCVCGNYCPEEKESKLIFPRSIRPLIGEYLGLGTVRSQDLGSTEDLTSTVGGGRVLEMKNELNPQYHVEWDKRYKVQPINITPLLPLDFITIPEMCGDCEFIGTMRYFLTHKLRWRTLDLYPGNTNLGRDGQVVDKLNSAIRSCPFWSSKISEVSIRSEGNKVFQLVNIEYWISGYHLSMEIELSVIALHIWHAFSKFSVKFSSKVRINRLSIKDKRTSFHNFPVLKTWFCSSASCPGHVNQTDFTFCI